MRTVFPNSVPVPHIPDSVAETQFQVADDEILLQDPNILPIGLAGILNSTILNFTNGK